MEHKLNGSLKFALIIIALILGLALIKIDAQTKETKEKLKEIKGAQKITITTESGDVVFEGKDAEKFLKKMKSDSHLNKFKFFSKKDIEDEDVMFFSGDSGEYEFDIMINDDDDFELLEHKDHERIEINKEDGKLKVTVEKNVDGKKETKVYEGEEAEKYLKDLKKEKNIEFFEGGDDKTIIIGDENSIWVTDDDEGGKKIKIRVESEVDKNSKSIIIKKIEKKKEKK